MLRTLNADSGRKIPDGAPISFVKKRWKDLVFANGGVDRRFYELCALDELKNSLRSADIFAKANSVSTIDCKADCEGGRNGGFCFAFCANPSDTKPNSSVKQITFFISIFPWLAIVHR